MEDDGGPTATIIFILLIVTDLFFYGFGAALRQLSPKELEQSAGEGDKRAGKLLAIVNSPYRYVNTVQVIMTLVNLTMGSVYLGLWRERIRLWLLNLAGGRLSQSLLEGASVLLAGLALLYILLTFGVLLPKKIAARYARRWAFSCVPVIGAVTVLLRPLTWLISASCDLVLRLFGVKAGVDEADVTEEEIIQMVNEGHEQGVIQASEAEMISNIFEYGDKEAQDIMTHRNNIQALDGGMSLRDALDFISQGKNSRYPVYQENIDHIIGILHLKDAMRYYGAEDKLKCPLEELTDLLREPEYVPLTKKIDELFREMQAAKLQMVIVVDEYGQTVGLVAMEDILEEIVGNIMDEYDEEKAYIQTKGEDEYVMDGLTPLEELEERFGISFGDTGFETLNGFLISRMDRIPEENESFQADQEGYRFKVLKVENKMIRSVLVRKLPQEPPGEGAPGEAPLEEPGK